MGTALPAGPRLASCKTRVARGLLLSREGSLSLRLVRYLTGALGCGIGLSSQNLSLALSLRGESGRFPLGGPHLSRLNNGVPRRLTGEDGRIISCGASPETGQRGLPRFSRRLEAIRELVALEGVHGLS